MKRVQLFILGGALLAVGGAFASNRPTIATIYHKPAGVCKKECTATVSPNICSQPLYSTMAKCLANQQDVSIAYRAN